ncbi:MAG: 30S ribosomal protein S9 [Sandaracinaceae bacterium]|nr:30S ribosomal protein S9 [Sandaracinaceae bacterium]MDW8247278.1 30S ribosomal protein S9 [Sandaracinaceae bacterium]
MWGPSDAMYGTGRRKTAMARVFLRPGSGQITVNGCSLEDYFPRLTSQLLVVQPFELTGTKGRYDVYATVRGGGISAQADAIRYGISRALLSGNAELRETLKKAGLLTRDARKKERKKPGQPGARKRFQYSKR